MFKKVLSFIFCVIFAAVCYAATDTFEGQVVTDAVTIEGVSTTDTVEGQVLTSAALCYDWAGYPDTAGTPNGETGNWEDYENSADRTYTRTWTATSDCSGGCTITHINIRYGSDINMGGLGGWLVVYNGTTKVGQIVASPSASTWTGDTEMTVVGGQTLAFSENDVLYFGFGFDGDGSNNCGISMDNGASDGYNQYNADAVSAAGPGTPMTMSASGSYQGAAILIKYSKVCP